MQSLISYTANSSQPVMLCEPQGYLRASVSYLEVAGKIAAPHMIMALSKYCSPICVPPPPAQHCLVLELDQGYA